MSDPNSSNQLGPRELITLPEQLRALPQVAPSASAWPELAAKLSSQPVPRITPRRRSWLVPAALAAGVVFAFATTALLQVPKPHNPGDSEATKNGAPASVSPAQTAKSDTTADAHGKAEDIAALQAHSRALEHWLHDTNNTSAPQSAQDLAASAEIEDMIGLVDVQLASPEAAAALPLWRRRVALLEDLATVRYSANLMQFKTGLAVNGVEPHAGVPNREVVTPITWNN